MANLLSLAPLTIGEAGPHELITAAASGGFDAVTLRVASPPGVPPVDLVTAADAGALRRQAADLGIGILATTGIWVAPDFSVARIEGLLATAAALGAGHCLAAAYDEEWPRLVANFAALCEAASRHGIAIAFEFMPYLPFGDIAAARRLLGEAGAPNAGLVIDALHLARSGGMPDDVAAVEPGHIAYLQLCDAPASRPAQLAPREESLRHRLYPGDGALPLKALLAALPASVDIDLEAPNAADAGLPITERARRAGAATRRFLATVGRSNRL